MKMVTGYITIVTPALTEISAEVNTMKAVPCMVQQVFDEGWISVTYHKSISKALKYCKQNGIPTNQIYRSDVHDIPYIHRRI
jgi:hypothetical protein